MCLTLLSCNLVNARFINIKLCLCFGEEANDTLPLMKPKRQIKGEKELQCC